MATFDGKYEGLRKAARDNRLKLNTEFNRAQREYDSGKLTYEGREQVKKEAQRVYDETRARLRSEYQALVAAERAALLKGLQQPPAGTVASEWRSIAQTVDQALFDHNGNGVEQLIDRAVTFVDAGLARGLAARTYQRFLKTGDRIDHLQKLADVDTPIAEAVSFEANYGALQPREVRLLGPFGGFD